MNRFWIAPLVLVILVVIPFLMWGDAITAMLEVDPETGSFGDSTIHGGLFGMSVLVADIALPIPTSSVIAGLGILYGPLEGAAWAVTGMMLAAVAGYGIGRYLGRPAATRWIGDHLSTGEHAFARYGGWIVAASRWLPVLPEVVSVVAGLSRMPFPAFLLAAFCGTLPLCAVFATIGHLGAGTPVWTLVLSALVPLALWAVAEATGLARRIGLSRRG